MGRPDVAIALDVSSLEDALALVDRLGDGGDLYKVGLELYTRAGVEAVRALRQRGKRVFLDLKLHDIPHTVARAVVSAAVAGAELLTVHVAGGGPMMEAAAGAAADAAGGGARGAVRIVGVTVLTSLSPALLGEVWGRPVPAVEDQVVRLSRMAVAAGLDGVVASVHEVAAIRGALGPAPLVVTPGIRLPGGESHDQARVAGPAEAARLGSDCLVVGRAVTAAPDPAAALAAVHAELSAPVGDP